MSAAQRFWLGLVYGAAFVLGVAYSPAWGLLATILFVTGLLAMVGAGMLVALFCVSLICLAIYSAIRAIGWGSLAGSRLHER